MPVHNALITHSWFQYDNTKTQCHCVTTCTKKRLINQHSREKDWKLMCSSCYLWNSSGNRKSLSSVILHEIQKHCFAIFSRDNIIRLKEATTSMVYLKKRLRDGLVSYILQGGEEGSLETIRCCFQMHNQQKFLK